MRKEEKMAEENKEKGLNRDLEDVTIKGDGDDKSSSPQESLQIGRAHV